MTCTPDWRPYKSLLSRLRFTCFTCAPSNDTVFLTLSEYLRHLSDEQPQAFDVATSSMSACIRFKRDLSSLSSSSSPLHPSSPRLLMRCDACALECANIDVFCEHLRCHLFSMPYICVKCAVAHRTPRAGAYHAQTEHHMQVRTMRRHHM